MLQQGSKVASKEGVHVHPYTTVLPDHQQADQVAIKPRFLVSAGEQWAIFERRPLGEFMHVRDAELERAWITSDVTREQRVAGEIAIGPHDEARMRILRSEERLERIFLSLAKGRQVGAPVGMVVRAWSVSSRRRRERYWTDCARKVVTVETVAHGHASVDFGNPGTIQSLSDIIDWGNLLGLETPSQGR